MALLLWYSYRNTRREERAEGEWDIGVVKKLAMSLFPLLSYRLLGSFHTREERSLKLDERLDVILD